MSPSATMNRGIDVEMTPSKSLGLRGMRWGVKASFVAYVAGVSDGVMSVTDGALDTPEGFIFPVADSSKFDSRSGMGELRFRGDVRLRAHGGMLAVRFADPCLSVSRKKAILTVVDAGGSRRCVAHLGRPQPGEGGGIYIPASLSAEAVPYFNDVYPVGTELDPLVIRGI